MDRVSLTRLGIRLPSGLRLRQSKIEEGKAKMEGFEIFGDLPPEMKAAIEQQMLQRRGVMERVALDKTSVREFLYTCAEDSAHQVELMLAMLANEGGAQAVHLLGMIRMSNHLRFGWCLECGEDHADAENLHMRSALGLEPLPEAEGTSGLDDMASTTNPTIKPMLSAPEIARRPAASKAPFPDIPLAPPDPGSAPTIRSSLKGKMLRWLDR